MRLLQKYLLSSLISNIPRYRHASIKFRVILKPLKPRKKWDIRSNDQNLLCLMDRFSKEKALPRLKTKLRKK